LSLTFGDTTYHVEVPEPLYGSADEIREAVRVLWRKPSELWTAADVRQGMKALLSLVLAMGQEVPGDPEGAAG